MHFYELIIVVNTAVSKTSSRFEESRVVFKRSTVMLPIGAPNQ